MWQHLFFSWGSISPYFFTTLFSQIIATSHLEPPCHPLSVVSPVTLAECLVMPIRLGQAQPQQDFIDLLTNTDGILFVPIAASVSQKAAEVRVRYGLKLPDALQIAAALVSGCDAFLTNDVALQRVTELRVLVLGALEI